jgi:oligopeptide/dipeptide ABC transporter ATP-binding protein
MSPRRQRRSVDASERFPTAPLDGPLLEVKDLKTHFKTGRGLVRAVDGVTFSLERGRTLGVVGESGSGKTVLSRSVMGLLPRRNVVREGSVRFENREIGDLGPGEMRGIWGSQMAMVFQDPMTALNPVTRVGNQITESLLYHLDITRAYADELALALLSSVGIPEPTRRMREYPHQLSGGMRQRVMIAIALACGPKILFADEPTTALDVTIQAQILDLLQAQQRERFMAMILVTHDLGVVAGRADEIAVMYAGKVVEKAPAAVLFRDMKMPYTEALLQSIPKIADKSHTRLRVIGGRPPVLINPAPGCRFASRCPYVQDKCRAEEPPLLPASTPGHEFRCWFPVGTPEGKAALERNRAAGIAPPAVEPVVVAGDGKSASPAIAPSGGAD